MPEWNMEGGRDDDPFSDEGFETEIPRIKTGVAGVDDQIQGGIPEHSLIVTIGGPGTGKTVFGLEFLREALRNDQKAMFIALEQSDTDILQTARELGWSFDQHVECGDLVVIDLDPLEMVGHLDTIRRELPILIKQFGASRLVLDSVSVLEMMYDDQATRRTQIFDLLNSLKNAGVTTMLTSEASEESAYASKYGIVEYLSDAELVFRYIRSADDFRETRMALEIQKIRDANHSREIKPYSLTATGMSVYEEANIF